MEKHQDSLQIEAFMLWYYEQYYQKRKQLEEYAINPEVMNIFNCDTSNGLEGIKKFIIHLESLNYITEKEKLQSIELIEAFIKFYHSSCTYGKNSFLK